MIPFQHGVFATAAGAASGFESIATVTATGGETSLTFSSIPQGYASLQIRTQLKDSYSSMVQSDIVVMKFNSDATVGNYYTHSLVGNGSSVSAGARQLNGGIEVTINTLGATNARTASIIDIHDYASTTHNKTARAFSGSDFNAGNTTGVVRLDSGAWFNTSAITTITFTTTATSFVAGATMSLYGIKGAA